MSCYSSLSRKNVGISCSGFHRLWTRFREKSSGRLKPIRVQNGSLCHGSGPIQHYLSTIAAFDRSANTETALWDSENDLELPFHRRGKDCSRDSVLHKEPELPQLYPKGVSFVRDACAAARAIKELTQASSSFIAWDTETTGVNPAIESPVSKGKVICLTAYGGEHLDFGSGPRLFVDCLDGEGGESLLYLFKGYFEDAGLYKIWHNYSFDRHILLNHGINVSGFGGDTMHMARLVDTSRQRYSLEELCNDYLDKSLRKLTMKERFGRRRILKDGSEGKEILVPPTLELQRNPAYRLAWIEYATADAELTLRLMEVLSNQLSTMEIVEKDPAASICSSLKELYELLFVPFGNMLIDMERTGFKVDVNQLIQAQKLADIDRDRLENRFRTWASQRCENARYMNINSGKQKQQLLFAPCKNIKTGEVMPIDKEFVVDQSEDMQKLIASDQSEEDAKNGKCAEENGKTVQQAEAKTAVRKPRKKFVLSGLGMTPPAYTTSGWPSISANTLRKLAGRPRADPPQFGLAADPETCFAIDDIMEASSISTLLSGFIVPLQALTDENGRIHASLNLNTETGRLSSRRPNLQNQPALEKDRYKVRNAFVCEPGNRLIVADYGQLELRLLAHITSCKSMIDAFEAGGDFHSRTALTMYDYIGDAVKRGDCLVEANDADVFERNAPLLKDLFAKERRRAKTLNFSIAYGKTAVGLAKDWGISLDEARETLKLWYKERQEVKRWQENCRRFARKHKFVETILGRRRHLPDVDSRVFSQRAHAERAAINAPLQGSAADLVMVAMLRLHNDHTLRALGWRVVLQIHDEIVFEGPEHSAEIARQVIQDIMLHPLDKPLRVAMTVEPRIVRSWFDAK